MRALAHGAVATKTQHKTQRKRSKWQCKCSCFMLHEINIMQRIRNTNATEMQRFCCIFECKCNGKGMRLLACLQHKLHTKTQHKRNKNATETQQCYHIYNAANRCALVTFLQRKRNIFCLHKIKKLLPKKHTRTQQKRNIKRNNHP